MKTWQYFSAMLVEYFEVRGGNKEHTNEGDHRV